MSCLVLIMLHCCVVPCVDYVALLVQYHVLTVAMFCSSFVEYHLCSACRVVWSHPAMSDVSVL